MTLDMLKAIWASLIPLVKLGAELFIVGSLFVAVVATFLIALRPLLPKI